MTSLRQWQRKQSSERGKYQVLDESLLEKLYKFKNLRRTRRTPRKGRKKRWERCNIKYGKTEIA